MNEKPTNADVEAAKAICRREYFKFDRAVLTETATIIARHMQPERELLRELAAVVCSDANPHEGPRCGKCPPCRARKLLEEA
jgi:hypothetical protein